MVFGYIVTAVMALQCVICWLLACSVASLAKRVGIAEKALAAVEKSCECLPRLENEVRDMRETLDGLPLDELQAAADYDKALLDGLENIANYSLSEAMKRTGDAS